MSDDEQESFNPIEHKKLLSEIQDLVKTQHIKKPTRSEPTNKLSEFSLIKRNYAESDEETENKVKKNKKKVTINNLTELVKKNTKQKQISSQLKTAFKADRVLKKPLEKVHADRLQRTVAYEETKKKLGRWDAVVTKNSTADQVFFPLNNDKTKFIEETEDDLHDRRYRSELGKKFQEIFPKKESTKEQPDAVKLSLKEMLEKRREMNRIKMRESYKISKARMQKKIKSKNYHKLKKREKLKEKMKEFEELKAQDPEAALKELEKIERQRVEERATLRHRNTGTWAKNLKVRAKYDKNIQKDLEAQVMISKELTQKQYEQSSSDSEAEETVPLSNTNGHNPWISGETDEKNELDELYSGYKKFWDEKNSNEKKLKEYRETVPDTSQKLVENVEEKEEIEELPKPPQKKRIKEVKKKADWVEEELNEESDSFLDDLFDKAEEKLKQSVEQKYKQLKRVTEPRGKQQKWNEKKQKNKISLEFNRGPNLNDIDVGLLEGDNVDESQERDDLESEKILREIEAKKKQKTDIDPDSFLTVKSKHLLTALPTTEEVDEMFQEDEDPAELNKMSLAEAFEDDDIVQDFAEQQEADKKPEDNGNFLPGWGSWGGEGVVKKKRFNKFISNVETPKKKDKIIINDDLSKDFKKHQVADLPFPFKSVKDFEASIRAPIGREFVPEKAHSFLTMTEVVTKMGTVIEPMTEEALLGGKNSFTFKMPKIKEKRMKKGKKLAANGGRSNKFMKKSKKL